MGHAAEDPQGLRQKLALQVQEHAAFDGWSQMALRAAARDLGLDRFEAENIFPGGAREVLEFLAALNDERMLAQLQDMDMSEMKIRDRIAAGIRLRIELLADHRESVRRGLALMALPRNVALGARIGWHTADSIWFAAGDTATDYNHYSKRSLLLGVYSSTLLFWLDDKSEGSEETWAFMDRRISDVLKVGGRFGKIMSKVMDFPDRLFTGPKPGAGLAGKSPARRKRRQRRSVRRAV